MAENDPKPEDAPDQSAEAALEHGTYEVIRNRLSAAGRELRARPEKLNVARKDVFGAIETTLLATERVTTEHNCIPRDMTPVGDCFLFGYNVHLGLKTVTAPADLFAVYRFEDHTFTPQPLDLIADEQFERDLQARIERLHDQLQESRQALHLSPENVQAVVEIALELTGQPPLQKAELPDVWPDPTGERQKCPVFYLPPLRGSWARCTEGLAHPHTGEIRPIVFDHNLARGRDDVVLVHLNHRLVQMSLRLLRAEVWSKRERPALHRVTVRLVPDHVLQNPVVIAHARLVVIGGNKHRLHEELIAAGGRFARDASAG